MITKALSAKGDTAGFADEHSFVMSGHLASIDVLDLVIALGGRLAGVEGQDVAFGVLGGIQSREKRGTRGEGGGREHSRRPRHELDTCATELLFLKWFIDHLAPSR
jgi:hypothetical protein